MLNKKWNLENIPPEGHTDVAEFSNNLFDIADAEKRRLKKNQDFLSNYSLYRGKKPTAVQNRVLANTPTPVNLYFSNIERTVANITARQPVGEVVDLDGIGDEAEKVLSMKLQKWWKETNQQTKTRMSARTMEIYGITAEKPHWDKAQHGPNIMLTDPFAFFPAPGNWENVAEEAPYICFAYLDFVSKIEKEFGVKDIFPEDAYELLGVVREEYKAESQHQRIGNYEDALIPADRQKGEDEKIERCLVKEIWVRDDSTRTVKEENPILDEFGQPVLDETGNPLIEQITRKEKVCPDGIRKITITRAKKEGTRDSYIVLDDSPNPNINPALDVELAKKTYPWGRLPVYTANSYKDLVSIWGFAAAEQVGDLLIKINRIVTKLVNYVINVMAPPLIVQQHCGITKAQIEASLEKAGRLVLMPTTPNARIEFMQIPNLPATFFQVLDLIVRFFDRIYATEEADRGEAPKGVIAASAIVALQERNQILMQAKTAAIEQIAEERSRWCIGLYQNFGIKTDTVEVGGEIRPFIGVNFAGRDFSYVIESGSTTPRTSLQVQELIVELATLGLVDQQAVLETLNIPGWQDIVARTMGIQPEQETDSSKPKGKKTTEAKTAKAGTPRAKQGKPKAKQ